MRLNEKRCGYDLIGDIHGHAEELIKLLQLLGYQESETGYQHPDRKVIFVGDFIDRGEQLRQHQQLLEVVITMVENGHARAVMGNHEFNALAFHTHLNGQPLRVHNSRNIKQHQAFLNEFEHEPELKQRMLDFFFKLPLCLELDGLRVVHACWHQEYVDWLTSQRTGNLLTHDLLVKASTEGTMAFSAVESLLKGVEVELPDGIHFYDKDRNPRSAVRVQWWNDQAASLGEIALPIGIEIGDAAKLPIPDHIPHYQPDHVPCFIGHYWMKGKPTPLTDNVACLDYSVAKGGKLVAYRWSGEQTLDTENFIHA